MFGADALGGRSTITDAPNAINATPMQTAPFPILFFVVKCPLATLPPLTLDSHRSEIQNFHRGGTGTVYEATA